MKTLSKSKNFLGLEKKYSSYDKSKIVILSAPLEKTVSYGVGTTNGPKGILEASHFVEFFDEEVKKEICFDFGIATLPQLNFKNLSSEKVLKKVSRKVSRLLDDNKFVVTLGGEHTISLPCIKSHFDVFQDLSILQIDAHSDLRDSYEGSKFSHASVMARVAEFTKDIHQVGIRAQDKIEAEYIKNNNINTYYMREIRSNKFSKNWQRKIVEGLNKNVYVTFDVDGFDPSLLPATGTPEPGGLFWDETMELIKEVGKRKNIIGFDVVELAPSKFHRSSNFVSAKLVYKILNFAFS